jgi:hypothetical protein
MLISISKISLLIKVGADLATSHSQLPPNLAPEPPNFDCCGTLTKAFLPMNDGGFGTNTTIAFD